MKRLDIVREAKITHVVAASLLLLSGVFFIVYPDIGGQPLRLMLGIDFIITGAARILGYFSNDLYRLAFQYDFALGILCAIVGGLIIIAPDSVMKTLAMGIGIYVLADALLKLQIALDARRFGMRKWIGLLVTSLVLTVLGVLVLLSFPSVKINSVRMIGIALAADAAENIWNTMATVRIRAKKKDLFEDVLEKYPARRKKSENTAPHGEETR